MKLSYIEIIIWNFGEKIVFLMNQKVIYNRNCSVISFEKRYIMHRYLTLKQIIFILTLFFFSLSPVLGDVLPSSSASGTNTCTNQTYSDVASFSLDVTSINAVFLSASFTTKMNSGITTRTGYYIISATGALTSNSGEISRSLVYVGGAGGKGIGSMVHIFDVSSVTGSVTFTLQHKNIEDGLLITTSGTLVGIGLTTTSGGKHLDYDVQRIETIDTDSLAVDTTWHNVCETSAITNPAGGNIFIASSINSKIDAPGTSADGEWKLQYKQGASGTWFDMGVSMSRSFADAAAIGMTGTVSVLENQSAADFYFRLRNRLANLSSDDVVTFNTNLVVFTLGTPSDGKTFPVYKVEGGPVAITSISLVTALEKSITPSNAASLYLHAQYSMSASATSNAPSFDLYVNNGIFNGLNQQRALADSDDTGSGMSVGLATGLLANTTYDMRLRHLSSSSDITLTTDDISLIGIQLSHNNDITWTGTSSTDWNTSGNWNGGIPGSSDNVIIPNVTNDPVVTGTRTCFDLNLATGAVLTISGSGNLTVGGNLTNQGTVTVSATLGISGSMNVQGGTLTINDPGAVTITNILTTTGTVNVNKTLTVNGDVTAESSGKITVNSPGDFTCGNCLIIKGGEFELFGGEVSTVDDFRTETSGSKVTISGGTFTIGDDWVKNLSNSSAYGTITLSGGTINIDEDCRFSSSGSLTGVMNGAFVLTVGGHFSNNSSNWTVSNGTVILTGEGHSSDTKVYPTSSSYDVKVYNLTINGSGNTFNFTRSSGNTGIIIINNFTFTAGTIKTINGSYHTDKFNITGTFSMGSGAHFKDAIESTDSYSVGSYSFDAASTYEFYGTTQNIPAATFGHLTVSAAGTKSISGSTTTTVAGNLNVSAGVLSVTETKGLTVTGSTTNSAGTGGIVIESSASGTGSLIHNTGSISGTVERYLTDSSWHFVTPSTTTVTANNFYWSDNPESWLVYHNESDNSFDNYITDLSTSLTVGQGYGVWLKDGAKSNAKATMTGTLQTSDKSVTLTTNGDGWNLIGNPFASAIDRDEGTWASGITTGTVYVWDNDFDADGEYLASGGDLTDNIIPISQGFFVKANSSGSYTIPTAARVHSTQSFYKDATTADRPFVKLSLTTGGFKTNVYVGFHEQGTLGFDNNLDADRLYGSYESPQMIIPEGDRNLCINATSPLVENETRIVLLHVDYFIDGEYDLTISDLDHLPGVQIILEDLLTGTSHDLIKNDTYQFSADTGDEPERFQLHFLYSPDGISEPEITHNNDIQIYASGSKIYIRSKGKALHKEGQVQIYDLLGRIIHEQEIGTYELVSIPLYTQQRCLIVKVQKGNAIKSTKIIF